MSDPRLDRRVQFDERSRAFPIRAAIAPTVKPRSYTWAVPVQLDQGREGACTGFATAHEAAARPVRVPGITDELARKVYHRARQLDEWPGEDYDGSSVLAAVKAGQEFGWYGEYRWAFTLEDALLALSYKGPLILGVNWYTGMFAPDAEGRLRVTGVVEGGHAILANRIDVKRGRIGLHNSWGGDCNGWLTFDDFDRLRREQGEVCVPVKRVMPK